MVSGGSTGGSILAGERKGSGSHSGEWRGSGVLSCAREKATGRQSLATAELGRAAPGQRENTETVAKQKHRYASILSIAEAASRLQPA